MISVHSIVGDQYSCYCPFHDDNTPSLSINLKKNAAICFAGCYAGSALGLIALAESVPLSVARRMLITNHIFVMERRSHLSNSLIECGSQEGDLTWESAEDCEYLLNRGFTSGVIGDWKILYNSVIKHIKIPVGEGWIYRTTGNIQPKYLYSRGLQKSKIIFGDDHFKHISYKRTVNIVEGPLDCIWLHQNGYSNTVAILGSYLSEAQMKQIKMWGREFVLCFDNDLAGRNATERAKELLGAEKCSEIKLPETAKDVQELNKEELEKIMEGEINA